MSTPTNPSSANGARDRRSRRPSRPAATAPSAGRRSMTPRSCCRDCVSRVQAVTRMWCSGSTPTSWPKPSITALSASMALATWNSISPFHGTIPSSFPSTTGTSPSSTTRRRCLSHRHHSVTWCQGGNGADLIIQDPRTSTPGLGLMLWLKAVYGDSAADAWRSLSSRVLTVTAGWSEAYGLFLRARRRWC